MTSEAVAFTFGCRLLTAAFSSPLRSSRSMAAVGRATDWRG